MTWPDYVAIALCIAMGIVESKRGFVPAFFAMIGVIITIQIAAATYTNLVSPSLSYASAYLVAVLIGVVIVAVATTLLKRYAPTDIGSFDSSLGGLVGVITGLLLAHAMFGAVILAYGGKLAPVYANSALAGQIYELQAYHGLMDFLSRIGTTDVAQ